MKKKIAMIVDADNWAFANIAKNVSKILNKFYDIKIIPTQYFNDDIIPVLLLVRDFDLIHFFWRGKLLDFSFDSFNKSTISLTSSKDIFMNKYFNNKIITTAVYDHLYMDNDIGIEMTNSMLKMCDQYYVSSNKLLNLYNNSRLLKKPLCEITDGVDLLYFYPKNINRFKNIKDRKIIVGWVGNSDWEKGKEDFKGVNTILKPAINELIEEGYPLEMFFADRKKRMIPHDEMIDYYSKIDLYICTSKIEGTPNPVLESMACGVPIITTDVGIVNEVFGKEQKKYILEARTKECLKEKIKLFLNNLDDISKIQNESAVNIQEWQWKIIAMKMKNFFDIAFKTYGNKVNK